MSLLAQPYRCDAPGCDRVRDSDANHWWLVWLDRHAAFSSAPQGFAVHLAPWRAELAIEAFVRHFCGMEHALSAVACEAQKVLDETHRKENPDAA